MKKLGLIVVLAVLLTLPLSALALEKMSGGDMGDVVGQAGVTIAFGGTSTTTIAFSQVAWGDPDGFGTCGSLPGWIILDGDIVIDQTIADGQTLVLDIGTTGGATCDISPTDAVQIPANTTFIAVGLPTTTMSISIPATLVVGMGDTSAAVDGTLGLLNLRNLSVSQGVPEKLYIWAHP